MFELKDDTPAAQAHSAKIGLGCAFVLLLVQVATLLFGKGPLDLQDLALCALIVMIGSDAASRLSTENRPVRRGMRVLSSISTIVAVLALTIGALR